MTYTPRCLVLFVGPNGRTRSPHVQSRSVLTASSQWDLQIRDFGMPCSARNAGSGASRLCAEKPYARSTERRPGRSHEPDADDRQCPALAQPVRPRSLGIGDAHGPAMGEGQSPRCTCGETPFARGRALLEALEGTAVSDKVVGQRLSGVGRVGLPTSGPTAFPLQTDASIPTFMSWPWDASSPRPCSISRAVRCATTAPPTYGCD